MLIGLKHDMSPAWFENARSSKQLNWNSLTLLRLRLKFDFKLFDFKLFCNWTVWYDADFSFLDKSNRGMVYT